MAFLVSTASNSEIFPRGKGRHSFFPWGSVLIRVASPIWKLAGTRGRKLYLFRWIRKDSECCSKKNWSNGLSYTCADFWGAMSLGTVSSCLLMRALTEVRGDNHREFYFENSESSLTESRVEKRVVSGKAQSLAYSSWPLTHFIPFPRLLRP